MSQEYKFIKLMNYFNKQKDNRITLTFNQIEEILGFSLCNSARKYYPYWKPSATHTITRSWIENGYIEDEIDLKTEIITFKKT